ncbi:MAG: hypothetical protein ACRESZ_11140 [Methylococcales bacterium]
MNKEIELFIDPFVKEIEGNNAAIFAGAGLSTPAGYANWKELLKPLADEIGGSNGQIQCSAGKS